DFHVTGVQTCALPISRIRAKQLSRRRFLAAGVMAGATAASAAITSADARIIKGEMPWAPGEADEPRPIQPGPNVHLTAAEAAFRSEERRVGKGWRPRG